MVQYCGMLNQALQLIQDDTVSIDGVATTKRPDRPNSSPFPKYSRRSRNNQKGVCTLLNRSWLECGRAWISVKSRGHHLYLLVRETQCFFCHSSLLHEILDKILDNLQRAATRRQVPTPSLACFKPSTVQWLTHGCLSIATGYTSQTYKARRAGNAPEAGPTAQRTTYNRSAPSHCTLHRIVIGLIAVH